MEQLNRMKRARRKTKRRGTVGGTKGKLEKGKSTQGNERRKEREEKSGTE